MRRLSKKLRRQIAEEFFMNGVSTHELASLFKTDTRVIEQIIRDYMIAQEKKNKKDKG